LLPTRQAFDLLHAAQESAAGPVGRFDSYRLRNLKQLLNGNIECSSKANCCFRKKPRLAVFIIGNHNLNRSHSTRQFFLAESPLFAKLRQAAAQGTVPSLRGISFLLPVESHNCGECKGQGKISVDFHS